jgi:hypothetical protein
MTLPTVLTASALALGGALLAAGPASASSACSDPVAGALHAAHDVTGDPGGLVHAAEETYCAVAP